MQNQNTSLLIGGNSLIGNFALIKDMNPKMQVRSKNPGANPKIQGGGLFRATNPNELKF